MRSVSTALARKEFATMVRSSERGHRVKLTRYNKTVAVLISKSDLTALEDCEKSAAGKSRRAAAGRRR